MAELAIRPTGKKLDGKVNYDAWANLMESDLRGQGLWRYCGAQEKDMRAAPTKLLTETDDQFEDRKDLHDGRIHKARAHLMLNCNQHIVEKCVPFKSAKDVWNHLAQYKPSGLSYEFSVYLEFENLRFDGKNLESFIDNYRGKLEQLKPTSLKISETQALFRFLVLLESYFPQFTATIRQQLRDRLANTPISANTLDRCITNLLDEDLAVVNAGSSSALIARGGTGLGRQPTQQRQPTRQNSGKHYTHCDKDGHVETDCFTKFPEKKVALDKKRKARKEEKADKGKDSKTEPQSHSNFHTAVASPSALPPAAPHQFGPPRMFMAATDSSSD